MPQTATKEAVKTKLSLGTAVVLMVGGLGLAGTFAFMSLSGVQSDVQSGVQKIDETPPPEDPIVGTALKVRSISQTISIFDPAPPSHFAAQEYKAGSTLLFQQYDANNGYRRGQVSTAQALSITSPDPNGGSLQRVELGYLGATSGSRLQPICLGPHTGPGPYYVDTHGNTYTSPQMRLSQRTTSTDCLTGE